jgi:hypothetical protein
MMWLLSMRAPVSDIRRIIVVVIVIAASGDVIGIVGRAELHRTGRRAGARHVVTSSGWRQVAIVGGGTHLVSKMLRIWKKPAKGVASQGRRVVKRGRRGSCTINVRMPHDEVLIV